MEKSITTLRQFYFITHDHSDLNDITHKKMSSFLTLTDWTQDFPLFQVASKVTPFKPTAVPSKDVSSGQYFSVCCIHTRWYHSLNEVEYSFYNVVEVPWELYDIIVLRMTIGSIYFDKVVTHEKSMKYQNIDMPKYLAFSTNSNGVPSKPSAFTH